MTPDQRLAQWFDITNKIADNNARLQAMAAEAQRIHAENAEFDRRLITMRKEIEADREASQGAPPQE